MMNIVEEKWNEIIEHLRVEHELSNVLSRPGFSLSRSTML